MAIAILTRATPIPTIIRPVTRGWSPRITAEKESTQEQQYDGKRIGNTQRQSGVCYDNERNDDRKCGHNNKDADS